MRTASLGGDVANTTYKEEPAPKDTKAVQAERRRVRSYQSQVDSGCKVYDKWNTDYKCDDLEGYYTGLAQWSEAEKDNYRINMCYPSLEIKLPSLLFFNPKAKIKPKPARADDPATLIDERAKMLEDAAQSFMEEEKVYFSPSTQLALKEAHYRFGVIKVGYSADYTDNPNVGKPVVDPKTNEPMVGSDGAEVLHGPYTLGEESLFCKRIPAKQFRVPVNAHNILEQNDWVAYYEFQSAEDVRQNPMFSNTDRVRSTARMRREYEDYYYEADDKEKDRQKHRDMVKLWRCWDQRSKTMYVWIDGSDFFLLTEGYSFLPFADIRFHDIMDEFYPLPPLYNWVSPQDELNETRQMQRIHRRRFKRRYLRLRNFCSQDEWDKLESGDDGTCAEVNNLDGIRPLEDASLDPAVARNIPETRMDFRYVTGVSGEEHGVADAKTATQSIQLESNSKTRELYARAKVGAWLSKIVKLMILTARQRMALPFWVERMVDPQGPGVMEETMRIATTWAALTHEDLGNFDFDVSVDLDSMTPATQQQERNDFITMLGVIQQPAMAILLSGSDFLLKRFLSGYGIRDDRTITEIRQAVQQTAIALAQMQMAEGGAPGGGAGGPARRPAQNGPPGPQVPGGAPRISSQLNGQMGMGGPRPGVH